MAYFYIGTTNFSAYTSALEVKYKHSYSAQTNAAGNTVVDYITRKRTISVEIIALDDTAEKSILDAIDAFSVSVKILEPKTKAIATISCKVEDYSVSYYTIQESKTMFQKFKLKFTEL